MSTALRARPEADAFGGGACGVWGWVMVRGSSGGDPELLALST